MKIFFSVLLTPILLIALVTPLSADTIKLKDGSVIKGQVIEFKDGQFTVLIGGGSKGRRGRTMVYVEDIESISFDAPGTQAAGDSDSGTAADSGTTSNNGPTSTPVNTPPVNTNTQPPAAPTFFTIKVSVRADNTNNGWTNTGLVVRRGQRLRITASGRVDLGRRGFSTPAGLPMSNDNDRLMRTEPTGGLLGVIGDDNDEFIFIGARHEFIAQRDGVLFLGVNEGELTDNRGSYDIVIEAEAGSPR
ncbi:MAG TPA: hypothetical protein VGN86_10750 [Pyrinomonadaceae bacterium]|jgi:hypothetical protein|nr:hypothetical protein [Pyrinomonadaceae bacterium]